MPSADHEIGFHVLPSGEKTKYFKKLHIILASFNAHIDQSNVEQRNKKLRNHLFAQVDWFQHVLPKNWLNHSNTFSQAFGITENSTTFELSKLDIKKILDCAGNILAGNPNNKINIGRATILYCIVSYSAQSTGLQKLNALEKLFDIYYATWQKTHNKDIEKVCDDILSQIGTLQLSSEEKKSIIDKEITFRKAGVKYICEHTRKYPNFLFQIIEHFKAIFFKQKELIHGSIHPQVLPAGMESPQPPLYTTNPNELPPPISNTQTQNNSMEVPVNIPVRMKTDDEETKHKIVRLCYFAVKRKETPDDANEYLKILEEVYKDDLENSYVRLAYYELTQIINDNNQDDKVPTQNFSHEVHATLAQKLQADNVIDELRLGEPYTFDPDLDLLICGHFYKAINLFWIQNPDSEKLNEYLKSIIQSYYVGLIKQFHHLEAKCHFTEGKKINTHYQRQYMQVASRLFELSASDPTGVLSTFCQMLEAPTALHPTEAEENKKKENPSLECQRQYSRMKEALLVEQSQEYVRKIIVFLKQNKISLSNTQKEKLQDLCIDLAKYMVELGLCAEHEKENKNNDIKNKCGEIITLLMLNQNEERPILNVNQLLTLINIRNSKDEEDLEHEKSQINYPILMKAVTARAIAIRKVGCYDEKRQSSSVKASKLEDDGAKTLTEVEYLEKRFNYIANINYSNLELARHYLIKPKDDENTNDKNYIKYDPVLALQYIIAASQCFGPELENARITVKGRSQKFLEMPYTGPLYQDGAPKTYKELKERLEKDVEKVLSEVVNACIHQHVESKLIRELLNRFSKNLQQLPPNHPLIVSLITLYKPEGVVSYQPGISHVGYVDILLKYASQYVPPIEKYNQDGKTLKEVFYDVRTSVVVFYETHVKPYYQDKTDQFEKLIQLWKALANNPENEKPYLDLIDFYLKHPGTAEGNELTVAAMLLNWVCDGNHPLVHTTCHYGSPRARWTQFVLFEKRKSLRLSIDNPKIAYECLIIAALQDDDPEISRLALKEILHSPRSEIDAEKRSLWQRYRRNPDDIQTLLELLDAYGKNVDKTAEIIKDIILNSSVATPLQKVQCHQKMYLIAKSNHDAVKMDSHYKGILGLYHDKTIAKLDINENTLTDEFRADLFGIITPLFQQEFYNSLNELFKNTIKLRGKKNSPQESIESDLRNLKLQFDNKYDIKKILDALQILKQLYPLNESRNKKITHFSKALTKLFNEISETFKIENFYNQEFDPNFPHYLKNLEESAFTMVGELYRPEKDANESNATKQALENIFEYLLYHFMHAAVSSVSNTAAMGYVVSYFINFSKDNPTLNAWGRYKKAIESEDTDTPSDPAEALIELLNHYEKTPAEIDYKHLFYNLTKTHPGLIKANQLRRVYPFRIKNNETLKNLKELFFSDTVKNEPEYENGNDVKCCRAIIRIAEIELKLRESLAKLSKHSDAEETVTQQHRDHIQTELAKIKKMADTGHTMSIIYYSQYYLTEMFKGGLTVMSPVERSVYLSTLQSVVMNESRITTELEKIDQLVGEEGMQQPNKVTLKDAVFQSTPAELRANASQFYKKVESSYLDNLKRLATAEGEDASGVQQAQSMLIDFYYQAVLFQYPEILLEEENKKVLMAIKTSGNVELCDNVIELLDRALVFINTHGSDYQNNYFLQINALRKNTFAKLSISSKSELKELIDNVNTTYASLSLRRLSRPSEKYSKMGEIGSRNSKDVEKFPTQKDLNYFLTRSNNPDRFNESEKNILENYLSGLENNRFHLHGKITDPVATFSLLLNLRGKLEEEDDLDFRLAKIIIAYFEYQIQGLTDELPTSNKDLEFLIELASGKREIKTENQSQKDEAVKMIKSARELIGDYLHLKKETNDKNRNNVYQNLSELWIRARNSGSSVDEFFHTFKECPEYTAKPSTELSARENARKIFNLIIEIKKLEEESAHLQKEKKSTFNFIFWSRGNNATLEEKNRALKTKKEALKAGVAAFDTKHSLGYLLLCLENESQFRLFTSNTSDIPLSFISKRQLSTSAVLDYANSYIDKEIMPGWIHSHLKLTGKGS